MFVRIGIPLCAASSTRIRGKIVAESGGFAPRSERALKITPFRYFLKSLKFLLLALSFLFPLIVAAAPAPVTFSGLALPVTPGSVGIAHLTATSAADDAITAVTSDCCAAVELHTHTMDHDIMRMRKLESVELPAGKPVTFAPGGLHVMLIGLKKPLAAGDAVSLTFHFAHAPAQTVAFTATAR